MRLTKTTLLIATVALGAGTAIAQGIDDPTRAPYYSAFEGKTVAYVPVAMGVDLTEGWAAGLRAALEPLGVKFEIRDPNWSTDAGEFKLCQRKRDTRQRFGCRNAFQYQTLDNRSNLGNRAGFFVWSGSHGKPLAQPYAE